jgi:hypothetical protein
MKDRAAIRERYLRDNLPVRLGGLAANLSRVKSFVTHGVSSDVVESLLDESKFFIEWTAAQAEHHAAAELVELQVQLARWQHKWATIWADPVQRKQVAEQASGWSARVLEMSGLLQK